jgi:hypothetical protein
MSSIDEVYLEVEVIECSKEVEIITEHEAVVTADTELESDILFNLDIMKDVEV